MPTMTTLNLLTRHVSEDGNAVVHLRPRRPLTFRAGQHGLLLVPGGGVRPLSIASPPEDDVLTFSTSVSSGSRFKRALAGLVPGTRVRLLGPIGGFTLSGTERSVVMLAQGIGVTPFRSMLQHVEAAGIATRTTLVHVGTSHPFRQDTHATASQSHYPSERDDFRRLVAAAVEQDPGALFMVSGSASFVRDTVTSLKDASVTSSRIRRDAFFGYRPTTGRGAVADGASALQASTTS